MLCTGRRCRDYARYVSFFAIARMLLRVGGRVQIIMSLWKRPQGEAKFLNRLGVSIFAALYVI